MTESRGTTYLGNSLWLSSFLLVVRGNAFGLDALGLGILLLIVGTEEVDLVVVVVLSSSGRGTSDKGVARGAGAGQRVELGGVRLDVGVPAGSVLGGGSCLDRLEDDDIRLRGDVAATRDIQRSCTITRKRARRMRVRGLG